MGNKRGFSSLPPEKQKEVAAKGGRAAHAAGTAHKFSSAEAIEAGKKGGHKVAQNRAYMAELGRKGGLTKQRRLREKTESVEQRKLREKLEAIK